MHQTCLAASGRARRERGFTLVELLVVVIVVAVLAGIAVPVFLNQRTKAIETALKSDLRQATQLMQDVQWSDTIGNQQVLCFSAAACSTGANNPVDVLDGQGMRFSPGVRVGDVWINYGANASFHLCLEHVDDSGRGTRFLAVDTWQGGRTYFKNVGGCPWTAINVTEPVPAP